MSQNTGQLRSRIIRSGIVLAAVALLPQAAHAQAGKTPPFGQRFSLSRLDVMALEGRRIVAKALETNDNREAAVVGAVHIKVPVDVLAEYFSDVETMLGRGVIVVQAGEFGAPPSTHDLAGLELPENDLQDLRNCRVGKCKVKLTRRQIEMLHDQIDWSRSDRERRAAMVLGRSLVRNLEAYRTRGNEALPVYHDRDDPLDSSRDFQAIVSQVEGFLAHDPDLVSYLESFPHVEVPGIDELYYWAVEDYTLKPVTTLNHMMISSRAAGDLPYTTIATKRIYASHYLQSSIELAILAPASDRYRLRGTHLVLYAHMRFDGHVGGIKRMLLVRKLEHIWALHLKALRERAEDRYRGNG